MAYVDFPNTPAGHKKRKEYWLSEDGLLLISGWRRRGVPLAEIAEKYIGISRTAFFGHWYKESDELRRACAVALETANMSVEEALLKKATGYYYWEESWELVEGEMRLVKKYKRHMPPDTKAILSWLYNRLPESWRAVQEPLDSTKYVDTIKDILVAMKQVADTGESATVKESSDELS